MGSAISTLDSCSRQSATGLHVRATSIGWFAEKLLRSGGTVGNVHSVFATTFNVEISDAWLMAITCVRGRHCLTVNVQPETSWSGIRAGMQVFVRNGWLMVPEAGVSMELTGAPVWKASLSGTRPAAPAEVAEATRTAARIGCRLGELSGLGWLLYRLADEKDSYAGRVSPPGWVRRADSAVEALLDAIGRGRTGAAVSAVRSLAGLGPGLTPSGDDLLAGLFGALWWREEVNEHPDVSMQDRLKQIALTSAGYTNTFGFQEAYCAAMGELPEAAVDVVAALVGGGTPNLSSRVQGLLALGSTSGTDMLTGICIAIAGVDSGQPAQKRKRGRLL